MSAPARPTGWWDAYRGIPYLASGLDRSGCNCWGLVRLVYAERLGLALPAFSGRADATDRIAWAETLGLREASWVVAGPAREFDVVLFEVGGLFHCGVVFSPRRRRFLHVCAGVSVCGESWVSLAWASRFRGLWRHRALA